MTLDEAIKRYADNAEYERTHGNLQGCLDFSQLAEWLKELKQLREQIRWIPVSERLPKERDWYLAVFKESDTGFQLIPRVADYIGRGENKWQLMDEDSLSSEYRDLLECIAWMPLPEPYKAESEEV